MPPLFGFLLKTHSRSTFFSRGKRYVHIDDRKGVIWYSKGRKKEPSAVLPLADVTVVHSDQQRGPARLQFVVQAPSTRLVLQAADDIELAVWVSSLRECASAWRFKQERGLRI